MKKSLFFILLLSASFGVKAQVADSVKANMIADWERAKLYTKAYLEAMPKDKYGLKAQDSVRTFAQQMLHLAQGTVMLGSNGINKPPIWPGANLEQSKTAQSADSVMYYTLASYDYVIEGLKALDVSKFWEKAGRGTFMFTRYAWIEKAFEHQTHHRGQTTVYIRIAGAKPPQEMLF
ncbi:MAG: damage-inducible protein DinB [Chitinophagaceae bacterium]|nr:MAG: damage-inducible protein DinB [Chitinophagaceae bacterium]